MRKSRRKGWNRAAIPKSVPCTVRKLPQSTHCPAPYQPRPRRRGDQCKFAHGEGELRSEGQRSSKESNTAEFSPAPPPPPAAARAPSSLAGDTTASSGSGGSGGSAFGGEAEVEGGIAPAELDEAYALQLQYDEQRCLKEEAQQAQRVRQGSPEHPAGGSYAAAASAGTEAPAAEMAPPGLPLPRLDSEAAFPSLQATGARSKAGSEAARSQQHSRTPSSGGCSTVDGASPMTGQFAVLCCAAWDAPSLARVPLPQAGWRVDTHVLAAFPPVPWSSACTTCGTLVL